MPPNIAAGLNRIPARGPRALDSLTEMPRFVMEAARLPLMLPTLLAQAPKGDGHPVMVLPGFTAGDDSTLSLRRFLTRLNYKTLPWLQGTNTGRPELLEGAMRRFYRTHHALETPISLVGQSLGGVFAREIAREFPDAVRCVITLGSPFATTDSTTVNPMMERLFERMSGMTVEEMRAQMPEVRLQQSLEMPATAVYSKEDGVVSWRTCIEPETEITENIRVTGSHSGMAVNDHVLHVVADRLAQDPDDWRRFDSSKGLRKWLYPSN